MIRKWKTLMEKVGLYLYWNYMYVVTGQKHGYGNRIKLLTRYGV